MHRTQRLAKLHKGESTPERTRERTAETITPSALRPVRTLASSASTSPSATSASSSAPSALTSGSPSAASLFTAEPTGAVIEAVKRADDGNGLIVRLYDAHGGRSRARIRSHVALTGVEECDLLERLLTPEASPAYAAWRASDVASHDAPVWDAQGWSCDLRPFEIRTFRMRW